MNVKFTRLDSACQLHAYNVAINDILTEQKFSYILGIVHCIFVNIMYIVVIQ